MATTNTLRDPRVADALTRMFDAAEQDGAAFQRAQERGFFTDYATLTAQARADLAADIYMPVDAPGGALLYTLVRAVRPATVVEFGTSFGISTLHLAAAVRDNGTGRVISTELSPTKAAAARRTFAETGLADLITVLEGDARETLADLSGPVDFVLLDGWKELCLPVLKILEPHMAPGTLVAADDVDLPELRPYLDYIRDPEHGYHSVTFFSGEGMEISCRL